MLDCGLFFLQPTLLPLPRSCPHFLPYHFAILAVMFFDLSLLGLFGPAAYSSLNDSIWSFGLCITLLVGSFVPLFPFGHPWPTSFPWPFFLTLRSHGLLLTLLGFPDPIALSFILVAHRLAINPLLSLLILLRAYCDPFSLFYITYYPWFATSLSSGSFRPVCFLNAHLFILMAHDPLFLPLEFNGFSIHLLTLFCPCC